MDPPHFHGINEDLTTTLDNAKISDKERDAVRGLLHLKQDAFAFQNPSMPWPLTNDLFLQQQRVETYIEGPIHDINLHPFTRVLLVHQAFRAKIMTRPEAPAQYHALYLNQASPLVSRFTATCACAPCPNIAGGHRYVFVQGEIHDAEDPTLITKSAVGVIRICFTHVRNAVATGVVDLSSGAQVYIVE